MHVHQRAKSKRLGLSETEVQEDALMFRIEEREGGWG